MCLSTHNLFATDEVTVVELWSTSSVVICGPAPATVMLVAAEHHGRLRKSYRLIFFTVA